MAKKIINIFFLLIFITQLLPVKQVGRILFQASMIEELPDKTPAKSSASCEDDHKHFISFPAYNNSLLANNIRSLYIHFSETLPGLMPGDVHSPPPDFS